MNASDRLEAMRARKEALGRRLATRRNAYFLAVTCAASGRCSESDCEDCRQRTFDAYEVAVDEYEKAVLALELYRTESKLPLWEGRFILREA